MTIKALSPEPGPRMSRLLRVTVLLGLGIVSLATIWYYRPANAEYRYQRMSLVSLQQVLDKDPNNAKAWRQMALRLVRDGDAALAEPALVRALQLNKNDSDLGVGLSNILMASNRYSEAFQLLKLTIAAHPKAALPHQALGYLYLSRNSYHHAVDEFQQALSVSTKASSESHAIWFQIAVCDLQMQKSADAETAINNALKYQPNEAHYLALKGEVESELGKIDDAIILEQQAARLAPTDIKIAKSLVGMLLDHHRTDKDLSDAEDTIGTLEQLSANDPTLPFLRGRLDMLRGRWDSSARFLEKAMRLTPQNDAIYFGLSQAYRRTGRSADSDKMLGLYTSRTDIRRQIENLQAGITGTRSDIPQIMKVVDLQMRLGDQQAAIATVGAGLQIDPNHAELNRWLRTLQSEGAHR